MSEQQKEWPNLYDEAHDMMVMSSTMMFLGKMRRLARDGKMLDEKTADAIMKCPITIDEIVAAKEANRAVISDLEGETAFGEKNVERVDLHKQMIRTCLRETLKAQGDLNPTQTWHVTEYVDENQQTELVYAIVVDDVMKRITVAFRGSETQKDWLSNVDAILVRKSNPLYGVGDNMCAPTIKQPKKLVMHRGFRDYVFDKCAHKGGEEATNKEEEGQQVENILGTKTSTKFDAIMDSLFRALEERPGYDIYTTGLSLGGALTTIFAMFCAAIDDPRLPKPITCYNFGSPKVGTIGFRNAFQSLEESGKLRCVRVANENDPVKSLPANPVRHCGVVLCSRNCAIFNQKLFYRHVGLTLVLNQEEGYSFDYTRLTNSYGRLLWDDWTEEELECRAFCAYCLGGEKANYKFNHSYPEYLHRLERNRDSLRKKDVGNLYELAAGMKVPWYFCPLFCPPPEPGEGEIRVHYY